MPSSICASSTRLNESRTVSAPRPSGKNSVPGTMPTSFSTARRARSTESAPSGSVSQEKKPPCGRVQRASVRHRALERRQHALALALVQRTREHQLLVDPAAANALLEEPLSERAGALVGVLLRRDEPGRDVGGADRPPEPDPGKHRLRRRARPARRRPARGSRGSGACRRRSRARGTRRPRRSGTRSGVRARRSGARRSAERLTPAGFWWSGML